MKVLFDTSVLVAATLTQHPRHVPYYAQLQVAQSKQIQGYVSTHSLAALYSVLTRLPIQPRVSPSYAKGVTLNLLQHLKAVPLDSKDYLAAIAQMETLNLTGGGIFDALIAQAAFKITTNRLLTLNPSHFIRLSVAIAQMTQVPE